MNTLLATIIVLALVAALAWLARRSTARRGAAGLAVERAISLGERRSLVVVSVEGRRLLLGVAPGSVTLVTELHPVPPQPEPAPVAPVP